MNKEQISQRFRQLVIENLRGTTQSLSSAESDSMHRESSGDRTLNKSAQDPSSLAVIAITVLAQVLEQTTATTIRELIIELQNAVECIKHTALYEMTDVGELHTSTISLYSGCELFMRSVTRQLSAISGVADLKLALKKISSRSSYITKLSSQSKKKVVKLFDPFFRDNMTVMIVGYSRVVMSVLLHAAKNLNRRFSVIIPEGRPDAEGYRSANELQNAGIPVTLVLDSAVAYVMGNVDFVLSGAEGVVESGGVINKIGTYQIAVIAKSHKKPFYVTAESFKFVRSYPLNQSDISNFEYINPPAYVRLPETHNIYNKIDTNEFKLKELDSKVIICNPTSDFTPPSYITLLFTDLGILTPSGVSDELIRLYT